MKTKTAKEGMWLTQAALRENEAWLNTKDNKLYTYQSLGWLSSAEDDSILNYIVNDVGKYKWTRSATDKITLSIPNEGRMILAVINLDLFRKYIKSIITFALSESNLADEWGKAMLNMIQKIADSDIVIDGKFTNPKTLGINQDVKIVDPSDSFAEILNMLYSSIPL